MGEIIIKQGDITQEYVEVIVNAANTRLAGGGGVDGAIHKAAGSSVMDECKKIGGCKTGKAVITNAGNLNVKKIIHTPGPIWYGGVSREEELLRGCYRNSLALAIENGLKSIAFPSISTGIYGYPIDKASEIAVFEGMKVVDKFDKIIYVCFSSQDHKIYEETYKKLH